MKAYLAIKFHANQANRNRIEGITTILQSLNTITYCVTRDIEHWGTVSLTPEELMVRSFDLIDTCDIMVVDLTEKGVGVGIEAGYAYARGVPIITIAQSNAPISETLRGISISVIRYDVLSDLKVAFSAILQ